MKRSFIVTLDLDPAVVAAGELRMIAELLLAELTGAGHNVIDVKPWSEHSDGDVSMTPDAFQLPPSDGF